jgi:hypothetical protein
LGCDVHHVQPKCIFQMNVSSTAYELFDSINISFE